MEEERILKKVKVLYVVSTLRVSGPTTQLLSIIKNLDLNTYEPHVLALSPEPSDTMLEDFINYKVEFSSLNLNRIEFMMKGKKRLKEKINKLNPDIIHTSGVRADEIISKVNKKAKHCMTIRNYAMEDYIAKFGNIKGKMLARIQIKAMRKCSYVICCSNSLREKYNNLFQNKFLYAIQNGVDTFKFSPLNSMDEKIKLRSLLNLPTDKKIFLVVGSLISRKDPITIVNAFNAIKDSDQAVLVFLGEGNLKQYCDKTGNSNIVFKGNVKNVDEYLKASDVFISASLSEGLPNSVLEAGSVGMDMILSKIPQHEEIFQGEEELVNFFDKKNVEDLSLNMFNLSKTEQSTYNAQISDYIHDTFSTINMSNNYQQMYKKMLEKV